MKQQFLMYESNPDQLKLISTGEWTLNSVHQIEKKLLTIPCDNKIVWDVSGISDFDSAGVLLFIEYFERLGKETEVVVVGYTENQKKMYDLLKQSDDFLAAGDIIDLRVGVKAFDKFDFITTVF